MNKYEGIMYHGTDKNILRMGEQERKRRLELCNEMADYAYGFLKSKNLCVVLKSQLSEPDKEKLGDIWNDLRNFGMTKYEGAKRDNSLYQYGALYVTNGFDRAARYAKASFICGESGDVAYWLYLGAKRYYDFYCVDSEKKRAMINAFEEALKINPEPIVVFLENLEKNNIKHENGNDIDWDKMEEDFIRGSIITSFRIVNSEDYDLASMRYIDIT